MNKIIYNIVFFCVFLLFIDLYFWQAFKSNFLFHLKSNTLLKAAYWIVSISTIPIIVYSMLNYQNPESPKYLIIVRAVIFSMYLGKFLACIPLFIDDILRVFRWLYEILYPANNTSSGNISISRLNFLKNLSLIIGSLVFGVMSWGIIYGRFNFKKHKLSIQLNKWPKKLDGLKIIHISDLHLGSFTSTKPIKDIVEIINNEEPDMIVFTGDLINNSYWEADDFISDLALLKAKYGKYAILGNHDYGDYLGIDKNTQSGMNKWQSNFNKMIAIHDKIGFDLLLNENRKIEINGSAFNLIGVENWGAGGFAKYGDFNKSVTGLDSNLSSILLSHDPSHWEHEVIKHPFPIELQLSGHTHGMQFGIEIGSFKWSPAKFRYPQWAGLYENKDQKIYVNRGLGHLGYAGRVGIYPEISILKIYS